MTSPYLTLDEVAEKLGVEYKTVYRLVRSGELPAGRVGRVYRVDRTDLDAYFKQQKQAVAQSTPAGSAGSSAGTGTPAIGGSAWTCPTCAERYLSELSVGGRCEDTGQPICQACWHIRRVRTTKPKPEPAAPTSIAPAHRAVNGSQAATPGVAPINGRAAQTPAVPEHAVTREQVATLGASLIRRFGQRLENLDQFSHPLSQQAVAFDKARTKHTVEEARGLATDAPGGPASRFQLKWGGWGKPKSALVLECRLVAHQALLEQDGYVHEPITAGEVLPLLESLATQAAKDDTLFHVLILSSPTGFDRAANELVTRATDGFHDRHLAVVLHDTTSGQAVVPKDERLADLMPLIDPAGYAARLDAACEPLAQTARDLGSIALPDAIDQLDGDAKLARDAMNKLGRASDLALDDLPGVGLVLSRR